VARFKLANKEYKNRRRAKLKIYFLFFLIFGLIALVTFKIVFDKDRVIKIKSKKPQVGLIREISLVKDGNFTKIDEINKSDIILAVPDSNQTNKTNKVDENNETNKTNEDNKTNEGKIAKIPTIVIVKNHISTKEINVSDLMQQFNMKKIIQIVLK